MFNELCFTQRTEIIPTPGNNRIGLFINYTRKMNCSIWIGLNRMWTKKNLLFNSDSGLQLWSIDWNQLRENNQHDECIGSIDEVVHCQSTRKVSEWMNDEWKRKRRRRMSSDEHLYMYSDPIRSINVCAYALIVQINASILIRKVLSFRNRKKQPCSFSVDLIESLDWLTIAFERERERKKNWYSKMIIKYDYCVNCPCAMNKKKGERTIERWTWEISSLVHWWLVQ